MTIVRADTRSAGLTQNYRKRTRNGFKNACVIRRYLRKIVIVINGYDHRDQHKK